MSPTEAALFVIVVFALIIFAVFLRFKRRGAAKIKGPFGTGLEIAGSNDPPLHQPGIYAKDIVSREGGILAEDSTGFGVDIQNVNAKEDVLISSQPLQQSSNPQSDHVPGVRAQSLYAGGNISIQQFISNQATQAQQLEFFFNQLGLENQVRAINFANSQHIAYMDAWKSLQALQVAGEDLWEKVNDENLVKFANQLRKTKSIVNEGKILFEDSDYEQLVQVLKIFGQFYVGKLHLIDIRSRRDIERHAIEVEESVDLLERMASNQITGNYRLKEQYESILVKIARSFRKRLANYSST